ncbi:MAG: hypothetical protein DRQ89_13065 [Epsilonproteobacteria bacterium]|nr:MAG: hypothetical protein DRQ89_13065 [Campylobacterota bacterium]
MKSYHVKLGVLIFLSNLFLYLALEYRPKDFQQIILPLHLTFKPKPGRLRIKIFDSFGELITDKVFLNLGSNEHYQGYFLAEIPPNEIPKITILKTDNFSARPFKEGVLMEENF